MHKSLAFLTGNLQMFSYAHWPRARSAHARPENDPPPGQPAVDVAQEASPGYAASRDSEAPILLDQYLVRSVDNPTMGSRYMPREGVPNPADHGNAPVGVLNPGCRDGAPEPVLR